MGNSMDDYIEQLGVITPVYIVGLITAAEAVLTAVDTTTNTKIVMYIAGLIFAIVLIYMVEFRHRKYKQKKEWLQLGAISFSSFLYLTLGYIRAFDITSLMWFDIDWLLIFVIVVAFWTFVAPFFVPKPPE